MRKSKITYEHRMINNDRWYEIDGKMYLGVTTALNHICDKDTQEFHLGWGATSKYESKKDCINSFKAMMTNAGNTGTNIHTHIENALSGVFLSEEELKDIPPKELKATNNFLEFLDKNNLTTSHSEVVIKSDKYGYAGTCDFIGEVNGQLMVIDWKSSANYSRVHEAQCEAYRWAAIEMGLIDHDCGAGVLYVAKDRIYHKLYTFKQHEFLFQQFLYCIHQYQWLYPEVIRGLSNKGVYDYAWESPMKKFYAVMEPQPEDFKQHLQLVKDDTQHISRNGDE